MVRRHSADPPHPSLARRIRDGWRRISRWLNSVMPKGLYARALLIIIAPMVILQSVVAFVFMERHWNLVTQHLSAGGGARHRGADRRLQRLSAGRRPRAASARSRRTASAWSVDFLPARRHAAAGTEAVLLAARPGAVGGAAQADRPAVLDRHRRPLGAGRDPHPARQHGDARVRPPQRRLRLEFRDLPALDGRHLARCCWPSPSSSCATRSSRSCGSPTPPKASARAARCRISGRAARARCGARRPAFIEMKTRIERAIEQRTAMLAGVSHDLRTVLTRFKLELALLGDAPGSRGDEEGRRRDGAHARGLSRLRARRHRRAVGADRHGGLPRRAQGRRRAQRPQGDRRVPRPADRHGAAGGVQALPRQSGVERGALCAVDRDHRPSRPSLSHRHGRRRRAGHSGRHARGGVQAVPAARRRAQPGRGRHRAWASRSRATSRARMAATSRSATARSAACARRCGCRSSRPSSASDVFAAVRSSRAARAARRRGPRRMQAGMRQRSSRKPAQRSARASSRSSAAMVRSRPSSSSSTQARARARTAAPRLARAPCRAGRARRCRRRSASSAASAPPWR